MSPEEFRTAKKVKHKTSGVIFEVLEYGRHGAMVKLKGPHGRPFLQGSFAVCRDYDPVKEKEPKNEV